MAKKKAEKALVTGQVYFNPSRLLLLALYPMEIFTRSPAMQTTAKYDEKYLKENKIQLLQELGNCSELSKAVIFHTVREYEVT